MDRGLIWCQTEALGEVPGGPCATAYGVYVLPSENLCWKPGLSHKMERLGREQLSLLSTL